MKADVGAVERGEAGGGGATIKDASLGQKIPPGPIPASVGKVRCGTTSRVGNYHFFIFLGARARSSRGLNSRVGGA